MIRRMDNNYVNSITGGDGRNRLARKGKLNLKKVEVLGKNKYKLIDEQGRVYEAAFMFPNGEIIREVELSSMDTDAILRINEYMGFPPNSEVIIYPAAPTPPDLHLT